MGDNCLSTSPRKKLKAHHDPQMTMADPMAKDMRSFVVQDSGPMQALDKETQCGITQYVSPHLPGFKGILKKRYTDFLVNEILPNGEVIHLTNLKKPSDQQQLNQAASKSSHQQNSSSAQAPSNANRGATAKGDAPERFAATGLNRVEQSSRKKETVYMRHGANTLDLVAKPGNSALEGSESTVNAEQNEEPTLEVVQQPTPNNSKILDDLVPVEAEDLQSRAPVKEQVQADRPSDESGPPHSCQPGVENSVGGWQAYAGSKTDETNFELSDEDRSLLNSYFRAEIVEQILTFFRRILVSPLRKARDFGSVTTNPIDRDVRTQIHQAIRRIFSSKLETVTDDSGAMVVTAAGPSSSWNSRSNAGRNAGRNDRNNKPQQPKGKLGWAQLGGDYLHFTIYKENKDTMEAISYLARVLKLRPQLFQFAGTKDRRGITVQRVSVYRVPVNKLLDAGRTLRHSKIGNFEYHPQGLQLGDLLGNEFLITLRDCHFELNEGSDINTKIEQAKSVLSTVVENFSSHGFINYFGLQRFGSFSTGTHTVGRCMLQGDFRAACEAILSFSPAALAAAQQDGEQEDSSIDRDDKARAYALDAFTTNGDSHLALEQLPHKFSAEACLIRHLSRSAHSNDYQGALQSINRNLRLMYVHAYQSLVWNVAVTARWKVHGDKVLPGDLVLVNDHPNPATKPVANDDAAVQVDQDGEPIIAAEPSDRAYTTDEIFTRARAVTESELASPDNKITIFDIVLPLPGYDILYPANDSAKIYEDFMSSEAGGGLDPHDMRRKWKDVSLSGSYRKLLAKPLGKVEWSVRAYGAKGDDEQFVETDLEKLEKEKAGPRLSYGDARNGKGYDGHVAGNDDAQRKDPSVDAPPPTTNQGSEDFPPGTIGATDAAVEAASADNECDEAKNDKIAVVLKMQLGSSTYATMALRELMKEGGVKTWKGDYSGGR
ncbi:MAG: hypothetical protein Q9184_003377 [Pyrenodesmia sp. 2 TL-2023]